jgi:hypothetical protein
MGAITAGLFGWRGHPRPMAYGKQSFARSLLRSTTTTKVPADLLGEVMVMWVTLPPTERDIFEIRAIRLLERKGYGGVRASCYDDHHPPDGTRRHIGGWRGSRSDTSRFGAGDIIPSRQLAAGGCEGPVVEGPDGQPVFIAASFRQRLLKNAASRGCA